MTPRLLNLLALLSLLLCLAATGLWIRGHVWGGAFEWRAKGQAYQVAWPVGRVARSDPPARHTRHRGTS